MKIQELLSREKQIRSFEPSYESTLHSPIEEGKKSQIIKQYKHLNQIK